MVESRDTRPATDAAFVTFTNGKAKNNAESLCNWIQQNNIKRSQIISLTMNETECEEGDQLLTVFYRKAPIAQDELDFEDLKFEHFNQNHSWTKLLTEADSKRRGVDVVSLTQSPKNIGGSQNQFLWYARGSNASGTPSFKTISRADGNWKELIEVDLKDWLNKFVPPHMLISISLYHDSHPEAPEDDGSVGPNPVNVCIAHTAGTTPQDLTGNEAVKDAPIYELSLVQGTGEWDDMFAQALEKVNEKGGQEGHCVASANDCSNDGGVILVLSWNSLVEGNLRETVRPATCMEQCSIF